jgi:hypothetical protein
LHLAVSIVVVFRAQQELVEKEQCEEIEKKKISSKHSEELRQQIRAKERERISERNDFFAEAEKLDEEARQRRLKLEEVKRKKLNELRYVDNVCYLIIKFICIPRIQ